MLAITIRAVLIGAAFLMSGAVSSASATTVTTNCPGTASTTDREFTVTTVAPGASCIAWGTGNINGNPNGNNPDPLFAILGPGYQFIDKTGSAPDILSVTGVGTRSGMWSFVLPAAPPGKLWTDIVLALRSSVSRLNPDWAAFGLQNGVTSGAWSIASGTQSLANANLYGRLVDAPPAVPLPAGGLMLIAGLGALAAARRYRRAG
jgi:hypothetical protein